VLVSLLSLLKIITTSLSLNNQFVLRNELDLDAEKVPASVTSAGMFEVMHMDPFQDINLLRKGALI
jgi:hypothetical protein